MFAAPARASDPSKVSKPGRKSTLWLVSRSRGTMIDRSAEAFLAQPSGCEALAQLGERWLSGTGPDDPSVVHAARRASAARVAAGDRRDVAQCWAAIAQR